MMEARKWEELPTDCLLDILGRVGIESLLLDIPFVCMSWYKASLNPLFWKHLDFLFGEDYDNTFFSRFESRYGFENICANKLVKGVINRSSGCATYLELPFFYGLDLSYVPDKCPALKTLVLCSPELSIMTPLSTVIGRFKNLEMFSIRRCTTSDFVEIVYNVGDDCQNFTTLNLVSDRYDFVSLEGDEVMAVVSSLPKLKAITLKWVWIDRQNLIKLINGCVDLVHLDVSDCYGFDGSDEQLLKLASHIPTYKSSGSVVDYYGDNGHLFNSFSAIPEFDFNLKINY